MTDLSERRGIGLPGVKARAERAGLDPSKIDIETDFAYDTLIMGYDGQTVGEPITRLDASDGVKFRDWMERTVSAIPKPGSSNWTAGDDAAET